MTIPAKYRRLFPINKTGNIDNERAQINKLFRAILEDMDTVSPDVIQAVLSEVASQVDQGDSISQWGGILGELENQEDLWNYIVLLLSHVEDSSDPHDTLSISLVAGEAIGGQRAVIIKDGEAFYADKDEESDVPLYVGISQHAASPSSAVRVQFSGTISEGSWEWNDGPVYLSNNGQLTQSKPSSGVVLNLGVATSPTTLLIHKTSNILRS